MSSALPPNLFRTLKRKKVFGKDPRKCIGITSKYKIICLCVLIYSEDRLWCYRNQPKQPCCFYY